jgi:hypothetical protein
MTPPERTSSFWLCHVYQCPCQSIEQQLYNRRTVQLSNAPIGPTMSSASSIESRMQPSQDWFGEALAGTTSATGRPKRVIRIGRRVRRTSSITARHVDLNFEIAISRMIDLYHSAGTRITSTFVWGRIVSCWPIFNRPLAPDCRSKKPIENRLAGYQPAPHKLADGARKCEAILASAKVDFDGSELASSENEF